MNNLKNMREVDRLTGEVDSWWKKSYMTIGKTQVRTWKGVALLAFIAGSTAASLWIASLNIQNNSSAEMLITSPLMKDIKSAGCVADGILSNYGGQTEKEAAMIGRSECLYLHRALETWAAPPDFEQAKKIMAEIRKEKPDMIFGMFLAEAINPNAVYFYPDEKRNFDFSKMCREKSQDFWGKNTCKGYFGSKEYRKYLQYITRQAIDAGIQSFLFGQIFFQDNGNEKKSMAGDIVEEMRKYAREKGKEIVIGAQTNNIDNEKYLRQFDYIEGGVGIDSDGEIESGPCFSKWSKAQNSCWGLLWHKRFSQKANAVLLHLDWSGFYEDDMSIFARMEKKERIKTVGKLYTHFLQKNMGFLLPYFAVINEENGSCHGPEKNYYSASRDYSCRDEEDLNLILQKNNPKNKARFVDQKVPEKMTVGQTYACEIRMKNTVKTDWTRETNYRLGAQNPKDNDLWLGRVRLDEDKKIKPGQTAIFKFEVQAPAEPGEYNFQWQMLEENIEWFGDLTENIKIAVLPASEEEKMSQTGENKAAEIENKKEPISSDENESAAVAD